METTKTCSISCLVDNEELEPTPDELDTMYQQLSVGDAFELSWKCPGRRQPTPIGVTDAEIVEDSTTEAMNKNLEFDFMDEVAAPTMRVRGQNAMPKTSVKKKTASFASVIDAMKKNKRTNLQQQSAKE